MANIDLTNIKMELLVWLRNEDIFTTTQRGVTTTTQKFNGNGTTTAFNLTQATAKNVRSVVVGVTAQTYGTQYTVSYGTTTTVTFTTAPAIGTENVEIQYDYGAGDKIFQDFPRSDLTISSFPRIGFDITTVTSADAGFGNVMVSDIDFDIIVYDDSIKDVENYLDDLRNKLITDRDSFYYMKRIIPVGVSPTLKSDMRGDKIFQKSLLLRSILNYEIN